MSTNNVTFEAAPAAGYDATAKQKSQAKTSRIPIKIVPAETLKKPDWIRVKAGSPPEPKGKLHLRRKVQAH